MAEFTSNNAKNTNNGFTLFQLNYSYYSNIFMKNVTNSHSKSSSTNELVQELKDLMLIYYQNLFYTYPLQKQVHDKGVKS